MHGKRTGSIVLIVLYCLYILLIFSNSAQTASESSQRSLRIVQQLNSLLFGGADIISEHLIRKAAHFTEFAGLGTLGYACVKRIISAFLTYRPSEACSISHSAAHSAALPATQSTAYSAALIAVFSAAASSVFFGLLTALTDETIQLFVEGRSGQITDVWIDFAGVCFGTAAAILCKLFKHMAFGL
ncbi:MAG: VanZ family protein [Clostridiales bacterium]|nr:VanZ family protein [Clostridiales bacterium]